MKLAIAIGPLLAGHKAEVVDFALAQLLATLLATNHPDVRERMLGQHYLLTGQLVPTVDRQVYKHRQRPRDWPPATTLGPNRSDYK
jgi:urea transporter